MLTSTTWNLELAIFRPGRNVDNLENPREVKYPLSFPLPNGLWYCIVAILFCSNIIFNVPVLQVPRHTDGLSSLIPFPMGRCLYLLLSPQWMKKSFLRLQMLFVLLPLKELRETSIITPQAEHQISFSIGLENLNRLYRKTVVLHNLL